jgi:hypothetical protein
MRPIVRRPGERAKGRKASHEKPSPHQRRRQLEPMPGVSRTLGFAGAVLGAALLAGRAGEPAV